MGLEKIGLKIGNFREVCSGGGWGKGQSVEKGWGKLKFDFFSGERWREWGKLFYICVPFAEVVKLVDTHVSGACARKGVGVRVPPSALPLS